VFTFASLTGWSLSIIPCLFWTGKGQKPGFHAENQSGSFYAVLKGIVE